MESLNDIKKRIKSVNDISQLTHAMQLVSASKMRKSKQQYDMVSPFFTLCAESLMELHRSAGDIDNPFLKLRQKKSVKQKKLKKQKKHDLRKKHDLQKRKLNM